MFVYRDAHGGNTAVYMTAMRRLDSDFDFLDLHVFNSTRIAFRELGLLIGRIRGVFHDSDSTRTAPVKLTVPANAKGRVFPQWTVDA